MIRPSRAADVVCCPPTVLVSFCAIVAPAERCWHEHGYLNRTRANAPLLLYRKRSEKQDCRILISHCRLGGYLQLAVRLDLIQRARPSSPAHGSQRLIYATQCTSRAHLAFEAVLPQSDADRLIIQSLEEVNDILMRLAVQEGVQMLP